VNSHDGSGSDVFTVFFFTNKGGRRRRTGDCAGAPLARAAAGSGSQAMHGDGAARKKAVENEPGHAGTHERRDSGWMGFGWCVSRGGGEWMGIFIEKRGGRHSIAARCVVCVRNVFFIIKLWMVTKQVQNNPLLLLVLAPSPDATLK
jgi:hypothetical protein